MMDKVSRKITQKVYKAELPILHYARHLMLIDICIKFREFVCLFVCLFVFVALRPKSTAMVIAGRSVHLTTLFPGQA